MDTPRIYFYSSKSENTLRFVNKVNLPAVRLPLRKNDPMPMPIADYILITPTFGAGKIAGSIPPMVKQFINETRGAHCVGLVGGGNTTFGAYCTAADLISQKLQIPVYQKFEVLGLPSDVEEFRQLIFRLFPEQAALAQAEPGLYSHVSNFQEVRRSF